MNISEKSRWSVVCNTMEDWIEFAEKLQDSKHKCEIELFKVIQENFLPALKEIYEEKEKRLMQKLNDLVPKRRIITRRAARKQNSVNKHNSTDSSGEDNTAYREHENRNRAHRLEERNRRANAEVNSIPKRKGRKPRYFEDYDDGEMSDEIEDDSSSGNSVRKHNLPKRRGGKRKYYNDDTDVSEEIGDEEERDINSRRTTRKKVIYYEDENDEESAEEVEPESGHSIDDKYVRDYYPLFSDDGRDIKNDVLKLIGEVKVYKDAWAFINPVKKEDAPGYYEMISQPIDLTIITQKLVDGSYFTINQLDADFRKLVSNCRLYNGENAVPTRMVNTVYKMFQAGMTKILEQDNMHLKDALYENRNASVRNKYVSKIIDRKSYTSKRSTSKFESKKRSLKICNMDALETLSRESELAVEKSNSNGYSESLQVTTEKQKSTFSSLKIQMIHSNPTEVVEKYMSDSSTQEINATENSNQHSLFADLESPSFIQNFNLSDNNESLSDSGECAYNQSVSDENSNNPVFPEKDDMDSGVQERDVSVSPTSNLQLKSNDNTPENLRNNRKSSSSSSSSLVHGMESILEDCNNQNVSNLISGFNREAVYSANRMNSRSSESPQSHKSDSSSPGHVQQTSQDLNSNSVQNSVVDKRTCFLQDSVSIQPESVYGNFSPSNASSTVDASVLGLSSFSRVSPNGSDHGNRQTSPVAQLENTVSPIYGHTTFTLPPPNSQFVNYNKNVLHQNPIQVLKPEPNKLPVVNIGLPPSTGNIVLIPGKTDPGQMTLHLMAQTHSSPSETIQSCVELRANGSSTSPINQINGENSTMNMGRQRSSIMEAVHFPTTVSDLNAILNPPVAASKRKSPVVEAIQIATTVPETLLHQTTQQQATNLLNHPVSPVYTNSFAPISTVPNPVVCRPENQLARFPYQNVLNVPPEKALRFPSSAIPNSECSSTFHQNKSSYKSVSSTINNSINNKRVKSKTVQKETISNSQRIYNSNNSNPVSSNLLPSFQKGAVSNSQRIYNSNNSNLLPSNGAPLNGNGQFRLLTVPRPDNAQHADKLFNQTASFYSPQVPFYPAPQTSPDQNYAFASGSMNPSFSFAQQVPPSQNSQFINIPNYIISNQNMYQHQLNPVVMNGMMSPPFHIGPRTILSMDGSR